MVRTALPALLLLIFYFFPFHSTAAVGNASSILVAAYNVSLRGALLEYDGYNFTITSGLIHIYYNLEGGYYEYIISLEVKVGNNLNNYSYSVQVYRDLAGSYSPIAVYYYRDTGLVAGTPIYDVGPISGRGAFKAVFGFSPIAANSFCILPFNVSSVLSGVRLSIKWVPPGGSISYQLPVATVTLHFSNESGGFVVSPCSQVACLPLYFGEGVSPDIVVPGGSIVVRDDSFQCAVSNGSGLVYVDRATSKTVVDGVVVALQAAGYGFACNANSVLGNISLVYDRSGFLREGEFRVPPSSTPILVSLLFFPFLEDKVVVLGDLTLDPTSLSTPQGVEGIVFASVTGRVYLSFEPVVSVERGPSVVPFLLLLVAVVLALVMVMRV